MPDFEAGPAKSATPPDKPKSQPKPMGQPAPSTPAKPGRPAPLPPRRPGPDKGPVRNHISHVVLYQAESEQTTDTRTFKLIHASVLDKLLGGESSGGDNSNQMQSNPGNPGKARCGGRGAAAGRGRPGRLAFAGIDPFIGSPERYSALVASRAHTDGVRDPVCLEGADSFRRPVCTHATARSQGRVGTATSGWANRTDDARTYALKSGAGQSLCGTDSIPGPPDGDSLP